SQERNASARGPRRLSINSCGSARTNSHQDPDRYDTTASYDQYGYPLHENACLGSGEAGPGTGGLVFTPTIKRLPDFYESRPKLRPDSVKQNLGRTKGAGLGQSSSMYERSTGWQADVDEIRRARRLAQQEEEEMHACTFQPSIPRRRGANASTLTRTVIGNLSSETLLKGGGGGGGGPHRGGAGGHGGASASGAEGRVNGAAASAPWRGVEGVGRRLFEESKRLSERRFEGEERKRMTQEEAFARTCTFAPSLAQGAAAHTNSARSRYMDAPRVVAPTAGRAAEEALTFHPKILGVQAGMTRAIEYLSLDVTERLHRPYPTTGQHPPAASRLSGEALGRHAEDERAGDNNQHCGKDKFECESDDGDANDGDGDDGDDGDDHDG
ncbi:unnamed protein product, partial [Laminaria digitata]